MLINDSMAQPPLWLRAALEAERAAKSNVRFTGLKPPQFKGYASRSKYAPHQGARECARRMKKQGTAWLNA